jgi:DNA-binding CsgD family transcriptional regulator
VKEFLVAILGPTDRRTDGPTFDARRTDARRSTFQDGTTPQPDAVPPGSGSAQLAQPSAPPLGLTRREEQVLELLGRGATNREIGQSLFISERTAAVHVSSIFRKARCRQPGAGRRPSRDDDWKTSTARDSLGGTDVRTLDSGGRGLRRHHDFHSDCDVRRTRPTRPSPSFWAPPKRSMSRTSGTDGPDIDLITITGGTG